MQRLIGGYLTACFAASLVASLTVAVASGRGFRGLATLDIGYVFAKLMGTLSLAALFTPFIAFFAALPALGLIAWLERRGERRGLVYTIAGFASGLAGCGLFMAFTNKSDMKDASLFLMMLPAGTVAGAVYWIMAGKFAGRPNPSGPAQ